MTKWLYCPECKKELTSNRYGPTCPNGHFTKYSTPVAATLAMVENNGEYLVIKRSHEPQKGLWDLPGGFVEPGENSIQTLYREIEEETKLPVEAGQFLGTFPSIYGDTGEATLAAGYVFQALNRKVILSEENSEYMWCKLENMPEMAFADCKQAILKLTEILSATY